MNELVHSVLSTHKLTAVLLVSVVNISRIVDNIVSIVNASDSDKDLICGALSKLTINSIYWNIDKSALAGILIQVLLDDYRITLSLDSSSRDKLGELLSELSTNINMRIWHVANDTRYMPVVSNEKGSIVNSVFIITSIDFINTHLLEMKFYDYTEEGM